MLSDERASIALESLRSRVEQYRTAIASTRAQMSDYLAAHREHRTDRTDLAATALGRFAGGRLDPNRFAAAFEGVRVLTSDDAERIERCIHTLDELLDAGDGLFICDVPSGSDVAAAIDQALARIGRAFGAALVFQTLKTQVFRDATHEPLLDALAFGRWNRMERLLAPPLVVIADGADVDPGALARFLDGRSLIVLVIRGQMAPAALTGLITPGTLVMQTADPADVVKAKESAGTAIVALVDAEAARFVHEPAGGSRLVDRLHVQFVPSANPQRAIGCMSATQQREQLAQLNTLIAATRAESQATAAQGMDAARAVADAAATGGDDIAVDTLAGWLLTQAGMTEQPTR